MDAIPSEVLESRFKIDKYGDRTFALYDGSELVCVTAYKRGAQEVKRRLIAYELLLMAAEREID